MTDIRADHARYEEWDAAYVLGALPPAERREFEDHLADCEACQAAVGALAAMPGLLSRLPSADAFALLAEPEALNADPGIGVHELTASLARAAARRRRRARGWTITALTAAAAVVLVALVIPPVLDAAGRQHSDVAVALVGSAPGPLSATVALTSHGWGTSIDMSCSYRAGVSGYGAGSYALTVTDAAGATTQVTTWWAKPGDEVTLTAATEVPESDIRSIELRDAATGAVLLSSKL